MAVPGSSAESDASFGPWAAAFTEGLTKTFAGTRLTVAAAAGLLSPLPTDDDAAALSSSVPVSIVV